MNAVLPGSRSAAGRWAWLAGWVVAAAALGALAATAADGADAVARATRVRYVGILASAVMAVGVLHALYPSPTAERLQLSNPGAVRLLWHQLGRWAPVPLVLAVPAVVIAGRAGDWTLAAEGATSAIAVGLYAFTRVAGLGPTVRAWERGEAGGWYRALYTWSPPIRYAVPDAMAPGLNRTAELFVAGAVLAIAGEAVGSGPAALVAPLALLAVAAVLVLRLRPTFDRAFWTSHGVWADAFRQVERVEGREPIRHDAVYWVPRSLRPAVWAGLVSMDRRLPLGRIAALGLGLVAVVHLVDAGPGAEAAALALVVLGLNGAIALTADDRVLPAEATVRTGGVGRWTAARFLMNVRWLPPLVAVLLLLVWLADLSWATVAVWTAVDLAIAALSAGLVTFAARLRLRRALA